MGCKESNQTKQNSSGEVYSSIFSNSDDIPPQMKIFNLFISILMHIFSFVSNLSIASRIKPHLIQKNFEVINDIKRIFEIIQSELGLLNPVL